MPSGNQEIYAEKGGVSGFMEPGKPETWRPAGPMETGRAAKAKNRQKRQQNSNSQSEFTWLSPEQMAYGRGLQGGMKNQSPPQPKNKSSKPQSCHRE